MTNNIIYNTVHAGRKWFDTVYDTGIRLQDRTEELVRNQLKDAVWLDDNARNTFETWFTTYKNGRDAIKKAVDENMDSVERLFTVQ